MKTDLTKILAVSGNSGLYRYISQGKSGVIVESLSTGERKMISVSSKVTALTDVSIYVLDDEKDEMKLQEVFNALTSALEGAKAPTSKSPKEEIVTFFEKAIPSYDASRFYFSHMKKVLDWYNCLAEHASVDFMTEEEAEVEASAE